MSDVVEATEPQQPVELPGDRGAFLPYAGATGLAVVAMVALVAATALPAAGVLQVGLTFLAVAMIARRLEDLPPDAGSAPVAWVAERLRRLGDDFGVEFYGLASLTAFLRAEARSLLQSDVSVADLLSNPVGTAITWLITEAIESLMNAIWATLWWLQLLRALPGLWVFAATLAAGWAVWRILDITPREGDLLDGLGQDLAELEELEELADGA